MSETLDEPLLILNKIAVHVYNGNYGSFLKAVADAWLCTNAENKRILRPAWVVLIDKYNLDKEAEG